MSLSKSQYFEYDKDQLLNALERFDGDITVDDVTDGANISYDSTNNHTVFLQVLLEFICSGFIPNEKHREVLLTEICERLSSLKVVDRSLLMHIKNPIRINLKQKFFEFVKQTIGDVIPDSDINPDAISYLENTNITSDPDICYYKCFQELQEIGRGGFGKVFKAMDILTQHFYAVKKICFNYKNDNCYLQVMREAKNIAALDHPNVVRYNKAWVEIASSNSGSENNSSDESDCKNSDNSHSFSAEGVSAIIMRDDSLAASSESLRTIESCISQESSNQYCNESSDSVIFEYSIDKYSEDVKVTVENTSSFTSEDTVDGGLCEEKNNSGTDSSSDVDDAPFKPNLTIYAMLYIQMEYCDCDLRFWLDERAKGNKLPFEMDVTEIFTNILKGVAHIHSKGIIHRDLKPQNIFYSKSSHCLKIGDFGLATLATFSDNKSTGQKACCHSSGIGTPPYAAPEQISSKSYDSKVDIYSLGIILIELLNTYSTSMEFFKSITEVKDGKLTEEMKNIPKLGSLAINLISKNPEDRREAKEILLDFEEDTKAKLKEAENALKAQAIEVRSLKEQVARLESTIRQKDEENKKLRAKINKLCKQ